MKLYVLTNGVDFLLETGDTGPLTIAAPMYFQTMTEAGAEIVKRPILAFMDYKPQLFELNP